jgi:hypothetical protein
VLVELARDYLGREPLVIGPGVNTGMPILYESPKDVGADRIVNGVAAYEKYHDTCIIVDFGTATTIDLISKKGEYIGGAIAGLSSRWRRYFSAPEAAPPRSSGRPKSSAAHGPIDSIGHFSATLNGSTVSCGGCKRKSARCQGHRHRLAPSLLRSAPHRCSGRILDARRTADHL